MSQNLVQTNRLQPDVQRQLGHASIRTTERAYGHLEESFLRGAPERVEAAIWHGRLELPAGAR